MGIYRKILSVPLLLTLDWPPALHAQIINLTDYERLAAAHGLSCNAVYCIFQDRRGFLWIGTVEGLNRYDGNTFTVFRRQPRDSTTLPEHHIYAICEDRAGYLWIGTHHGLLRFDPATEAFAQYVHDPEDSTSIGYGWIRDIHEDRFGNFWVLTGPSGIHLMDRQTGKFTNITKGVKPSEYFDCYGIYEDRNGKIWAPGWSGLGRIDIRASESPREIRDSVNYSESSAVISRGYRKIPDPFTPNFGFFPTFYEDHDGLCWAGGSEGLF